MNGLTVPARRSGEEQEPSRCVSSPRCSVCSVNGLADPFDLCGQICSQAIVVMFEVFDQGLEVADPRPESSALQEETIISIHPLTQQRFGHTYSDPSRMRRAMGDSCGRLRTFFPSRGSSRVSPRSRQVNVTNPSPFRESGISVPRAGQVRNITVGQPDCLGRGWHRGQEYDERFMKASRRMRVPHRGQGRPSRP